MAQHESAPDHLRSKVDFCSGEGGREDQRAEVGEASGRNQEHDVRQHGRGSVEGGTYGTVQRRADVDGTTKVKPSEAIRRNSSKKAMGVKLPAHSPQQDGRTLHRARPHSKEKAMGSSGFKCHSVASKDRDFDTLASGDFSSRVHFVSHPRLAQGSIRPSEHLERNSGVAPP